MEERPSTQPSQKLPRSKKTLDWAKKNLLYWENVLMSDESSSRKVNMSRNDDLFHRGKMSREEVASIVNPYNLKDFVIPEDFKNFPIGDSRVNTLLGEEIKRRFDWRIFVTNRDAVSQIENDKKDLFVKLITDQIHAESLDQEILDVKLKKFQEYISSDYQDIKEKSCNELLHHYSLYLDLKTIYSRAWKDMVLFGESVINIDCINGKPFAERVDPRTLYWAHNSQYPYIDDADAVIREHYMPLGHVIDYYYEFLTDSDIKTLEEKRDSLSSRQFTIGQQWNKDNVTGVIIPNSEPLYVDGDRENNSFQGYYDGQGNVRVIHLRWLSLKKVGKLTYIDDSGTEQEMWVSEDYVKQPSDSVEWFWINEPWEVTQIGEDIFVKAEERKVQFRKLDNKSATSLGYVGTYMDKSIYDVIKEYQIKCNAYAYRTEQAMIKALGKIGVLDLSMIPDDWDLDMWMYAATVMGWAVTDSFKEGKKGAATGKLAGNTGNDRSNVINLEQGQAVAQNIQMLQYLEAQMDVVIGTPPARRGASSPSDGLGTTEIARQASSTITESYYTIHDNIKKRVLERVLEVAKYAIKDKVESIQYVTSDMTSRIFEIDGPLINEAEYGLTIGNASDDIDAINTLKRATEIALQTGEVDLIQLMDINSNQSASEIRRKIEKSVIEKRNAKAEEAKAMQEAEAQNRQMQLELLQKANEDREKDRELAYYKINADNETKLAIAELTSLGMTKAEPVDIIGQAELSLKEIQHNEEVFTKRTEEELRRKEHNDNLAIERKKVEQKDRELKAKERIAELTAKNKLAVEKIKLRNKVSGEK